MHRVAALTIASAVAITSAQAQTATELRISGAVEKLDCTGSAYCRHQGRLGGHDDRNETGGASIGPPGADTPPL